MRELPAVFVVLPHRNDENEVVILSIYGPGGGTRFQRCPRSHPGNATSAPS